jgi:hypothetical protein
LETLAVASTAEMMAHASVEMTGNYLAPESAGQSASRVVVH